MKQDPQEDKGVLQRLENELRSKDALVYQAPKPETRNTKHETRHPNIRNLKSETRHPNIPNPKPKALRSESALRSREALIHQNP